VKVRGPRDAKALTASVGEVVHTKERRSIEQFMQAQEDSLPWHARWHLVCSALALPSQENIDDTRDFVNQLILM
jgi:hypothetical protein